MAFLVLMMMFAFIGKPENIDYSTSPIGFTLKYYWWESWLFLALFFSLFLAITILVTKNVFRFLYRHSKNIFHKNFH